MPTPRMGRADLRGAQGPVRPVEVVQADPYLSLRDVAGYAGLSVRTVRRLIALPGADALPCYRLPGKILVRRSEFNAWMARFRTVGTGDVEGLVDEILNRRR
jgi:excisionase family DNA binding protein